MIPADGYVAVFSRITENAEVQYWPVPLICWTTSPDGLATGHCLSKAGRPMYAESAPNFSGYMLVADWEARGLAIMRRRYDAQHAGATR